MGRGQGKKGEYVPPCSKKSTFRGRFDDSYKGISEDTVGNEWAGRGPG